MRLSTFLQPSEGTLFSLGILTNLAPFSVPVGPETSGSVWLNVLLPQLGGVPFWHSANDRCPPLMAGVAHGP